MSKKYNSLLQTFILFLSRYKFGIMLVLFIAASTYFFFNQAYRKKIKTVNIEVCQSTSVDSILTINNVEVVPILYQRVPDLTEIHYKERMVKFVDLMLPSILLAKKKMNEKLLEVKALHKKIESGNAISSDSAYLANLLLEYKSNDVDELIKRLHTHPVSIILAQAAVESGWATSRFCREANNIYGIWSYNSSEKRIRANESRQGTNVYLRKYDSLFESVYDYLQTIAKVHAYSEFREVRAESENPYRLIWYLSNYSEKRYEYVRTLRNVIEFNDLHKYDTYTLAKISSDDKVWQNILQ